jgi:hypothetical protein
MAVPELTSAAIREIKRLVDNCACLRPVVIVAREGRKVENRRGPNGETIWDVIAEGSWMVVVFEYNPVRDANTITAYGLEFSDAFLDRAVKLDFRDGAFISARAPE